jgi:hypothetical protein
MGVQRSFLRKVIYLVAMVPLLGVLFWLGQPGTPPSESQPGAAGGVLTQMRQREGLTQTHIGELDPASETIKLATLGLRGVAAMILWEKANDHKMRKNWFKLSATLEQLAKVQPHFISVWRFQCWNLSYNCSVEFDDYRDRYRWVMKGIEHLKKGITYNRHEPILVWDVGWFISQKIGKSDEHKQFRRLFREDDDFHGARPLPLRDSWLVGKEWFREAEAMVDRGDKVKSGPLLFRSHAPLCQMYYSDTLEKEGTFGEVAHRAWKQAALDWYHYGQFDMTTSDGTIYRLNDQEMYEESLRRLTEQIDQMAPGAREKIFERKLAGLSREMRQALETHPEKRSPKQVDLAARAEEEIKVTYDEVARSVTGPQRRKALELANKAKQCEDMIRTIKSNRMTVNFNYWRLKAQVEQTADAIAARQAAYEAQTAYKRGEILTARELCERAAGLWRKVIDEFPAIKEERSFVDDIMDLVKQYRTVLAQFNAKLPPDFILGDIVEAAKKHEI